MDEAEQAQAMADRREQAVRFRREQEEQRAARQAEQRAHIEARQQERRARIEQRMQMQLEYPDEDLADLEGFGHRALTAHGIEYTGAAGRYMEARQRAWRDAHLEMLEDGQPGMAGFNRDREMFERRARDAGRQQVLLEQARAMLCYTL